MRAKRMMLGACVAVAVLIAACCTMSTIWTATYWHGELGVRLSSGNVLLRQIEAMPGYGVDPTQGLTIERSLNQGFNFETPTVQSFGGRLSFVRLPLWVPMVAVSLAAVILWRLSRRSPSPGR